MFFGKLGITPPFNEPKNVSGAESYQPPQTDGRDAQSAQRPLRDLQKLGDLLRSEQLYQRRLLS